MTTDEAHVSYIVAARRGVAGCPAWAALAGAARTGTRSRVVVLVVAGRLEGWLMFVRDQWGEGRREGREGKRRKGR